MFISLILASASPRRRDLMAEAGFDFEIRSADVDEHPGHGEGHDLERVAELTMANARLKAEAVAAEVREAAVVIGADTVVTLDGRVLGKPASRREAFDMIRTLNGRTHQVLTGVCVTAAPPQSGARTEKFHVETEVEFKTLTEEELRRYHGLIDPMDKAGAYAAQDHGELIIREVRGSWTNVVGLPMEKLGEVLRTFGIEPTTRVR